jgi:hypothetical protein
MNLASTVPVADPSPVPEACNMLLLLLLPRHRGALL